VTEILTGGCHCGGVKVRFETSVTPEELQVRACQCSFCRKHGALTASDGSGSLTFSAEPDALQLYRFGSGSADFLICRNCGAYVGVVMEIDGATYGVVNVNTLDDPAPFARAPDAMNYEHETVEARMARRKKFWSPATMPSLAG
jgi:hypothetical protein